MPTDLDYTAYFDLFVKMPIGENLAVLKKQRAVIKGSCTRIKTYVESVTAINTAVTAQLEERKLKLEQYWLEYNAVQSQIEILEEAESDDRAAFEDAFYAVSSKMRELINPPGNTRGVARSPTTVSEASDATTRVRLPKLNLPTFSGRYDEWFPFFDTFASVIHFNASLSCVQKLQYLKASLTGDASNVISSLEISDANYDVAWTLLKERYDNKRVIVQNHIKAILELPSMAKENYNELRQIADGATKHLHALQALKRPVDHWNDILIHVLCSKIDTLTLRDWQSSSAGSELPTLKQFFGFITHRCQMLEVTNKPSIVANMKGGIARSSAKRQMACVATLKSKCSYCQGEHSIYYCKDFLELQIPQRISEIRTRKICLNCLRSTTHVSSKCTSGGCKVCQAKHNTLLHITPTAPQSSDSSDSGRKGNDKSKSSSASSVVATHVIGHSGNVMLSTAMVHAHDHQEIPRPCRVLLDCGSQANFISRKFVTKLGLIPISLDVAISGVNGTVSTTTQAVQVKLQSRIDLYRATIDCIVVDRVTDKLPGIMLRRKDFKFPRNIKLADPQFHIPSEIDILIGAEIFWDLLCVGQISSSDRHPKLQKTKLGWILAGRKFESKAQTRVHSFHASITNEQLHDQLNRFWQMDDAVGHSSNLTPDENYCEQHFLNNVYQNSQGRYVVKLPVREQLIDKLGDSRNIAVSRFRSLENRFKRQPELKEQYKRFIDEYISLGHMRRIDPQDDDTVTAFYLPHHCVFKSNNQTSKIRVVFDASCKTDAGLSLNDALVVGPVVQQDLISILIRFRFFMYVFSADIIKMYRQILIDPSQVCLQRILWRNDPTSSIDTYELLTVTYGTSSASYLATRCLNYHAEQHATRYPVGSRHVRRGFYVDDFLSGADTIREAMELRDELIELLKLGSFELSKWASNCSNLLENIKDRNSELITIQDEMDSNILGIQWNQAKDTFHFAYNTVSTNSAISKRTILSEVSRLFDPLGLLGPVIVVAKLILQNLWKSNLHWDESVPQEIHTSWLRLKSQLYDINQLQISRCVKFNSDLQSVQLQGFCDASQDAYGACIYVRTKLGLNEYRSELLCSKSRVAPLKAVSLPRLELSAAVLLARLIDKVKESLEEPIQTCLWSDSTIALNWIASSSRNWSVFVANRVGEIQRLTQISDWRHVPSCDNPADILSRGLYPHELVASHMWWQGPNFLRLHEDCWPSGRFAIRDDMPEQKRIVATVARIEQCTVSELLNKHSSLGKICRIIAYCMRFFEGRRPATPTNLISSTEKSFALETVCKVVQNQVFANEYEALRLGTAINSNSRLLSLSPFMNKDGLIRVGGRLKNSNLDFDACHPILLPRNHELTRKIIREEHVRNMHAGTQATMAFVRQRFWPISLRSAARKIIQECVICFKSKPRQSEAIMGSLPAGRVTPSRPFTHCGVDYAGPVILREGKRRNARNNKAYIAIFVCFATKATHIEVVSDLTTDSFLGAFKRFIARRGRPSRMYSDNGTTFVGAQKQIKELYEFHRKQETHSDLYQYFSGQGIAWSFIPPNAPHFGGLWEAAVKCAKYHMARIVGQAHLTFEEMQTVLSEIEAILNSRPIIPLSEDPNDLSYLSPGHFLIGTALNSFPCDDVSDIKENRLLRWQRIEQVKQHFWRRWSSEYLSSLQGRSKWKKNAGIQLRPNQLVLVKQQNLAPLQWVLGRVLEVHPGSDQVVRTATIKTPKGEFVRPLSKIAILPLEA